MNKYFLLLFFSLELIFSFTYKDIKSVKNGTYKFLRKLPSKFVDTQGWTVLGNSGVSLAKRSFLKGFVLTGSMPHILTLDLPDGIDTRKTPKDNQFIKLKDNKWHTYQVKKGNVKETYWSFTAHKDAVYYFKGFRFLKKYLKGKETPIGKGYSPAFPKMGNSFKPVLDFNGDIPVVIWYDGDVSRNKDTYYNGQLLSCSTFKNNKWMWVGRRGFQRDASDPVIKVSGGVVYALFQDYRKETFMPSKTRLTVMRFKEKAWEIVGKRSFTPHITGNYGTYNMDVYDGIVYVSAHGSIIRPSKPALKRVFVMKHDIKWTTIGEFSLKYSSPKSSLRVDNNGVPHLAYIDKYSQIVTLKYNGRKWKKLGEIGYQDFREAGKGNLISSVSVQNVILRFDQVDSPYIAMQQRVSFSSKGGKKPFPAIQIFVLKGE